MTNVPQDQVARWATMFDALAPSYDQSGVPFFGTIAEGLVSHLAPAPGERALDIGAGRGAVTLRIADLVGSAGHVDAIDIAPSMVDLTAQTVRERNLGHVHVAIGDATDPKLRTGTYDLIASSLVLFFLPEPEQALRRWRPLLVPGGRVGASTFRPWPATWQAIEDVFAEYAPEAAGTPPTAMPAVFDDDAAVEGLFTAAGFSDVRTEVATYAIPFEDVEQWKAWSAGTAMRGLWLRAPEARHGEITERVARILRDAGGRLEVGIRYTFGAA